MPIMMKTLHLILILLIPFSLCNPFLQVVDLDTDFQEDSLVSDLNMNSESDDAHILQFTAFGQKYFTSLKRADSIFAPNFQIKTTSNITIEDYESKSLGGKFYSGKNGKGSYYVDIIDGQVRVDGIVNDQVRIWNENGVHKAYRVQNNYIPDAFVNDQIKQGSFEQKESCIETVAPEPKSTSGDVPKPVTEANTNSPDLPEVVVVEVYTFIDSLLHDSLKENKIPIQKYLGLLWNHVQNKYESTHNPRIEFAITACDILPITEWMKSSYVKHLGKNVVNSHKLLMNFGDWLFEKKNQVDDPHYDIAIMHTGYDLASPVNYFNYEKGNLGVAFVEGVCVFDNGENRVLSCGLMEDMKPSMKFEGIITVAHEVAHLFGAPHDNELPASENCPDNYIMYYALGNDTIEKFSDCSLKRIRAHLSKEQCACVRDTTRATSIPMLIPDEKETTKPDLNPDGKETERPGIDPDDLCTERLGEKSRAKKEMFRSNNPCEILFCFVSEYRSAAIIGIPDGLICGKNKRCENKICK